MQKADPCIDSPARPVRLGETACHVERQPDGGIRMRLKEPLAAYPRRYTDRLVQWATTTPEQVFLARRPPGGPNVGAWETLSYRQTLEQVRAIAQALLRRELSRERPVVILSENDFENQLLALACTHVGIPYVPVTPAYSLMSKDYAKLKFLNGRVRPGLVFASNAAQYENAARAAFPQAECVATRSEGSAATPFATLLSCDAGPAVDAAFDAIEPEDVAKLLFTSGTTGEPKGVQLTHRNNWLNAVVFGWHLGLSDRDVYLHTLPSFHANGWGMPYAITGMGVRQVILRKIDGTLAQRYVREFDDKWLRGGAPAEEPFLGSGDIQSLADLGNSFEVVKSMRWVPFTSQTVMQLAATTVAPVVPLTLTMISLEELLSRVLKIVF